MSSKKQIATERQLINDTIRLFFRTRGYIEVETPILVQSPGMESNLHPFETSLIEVGGTSHDSALITSPEYSMKKLLGEGMEKIFTITKVFRNQEEFGGVHNPEFSMLEWYQQGADYQECIQETEDLIRFVSMELGLETVSPEAFQGVRIRELFLKHCDVDLDVANQDSLLNACKRLGIHTDASDSESDLYYRLFLAKIEPNLGKDPVFLYDYPAHQAALSRLSSDRRYGERFELYINGIELCNGFTELTDADEQRNRFEQEAQERAGLQKTVFPIDEDLLALLPSIQTPTFGNALGIDRLHMVLTGRRSIEDVLLFPAKKLFYY